MTEEGKPEEPRREAIELHPRFDRLAGPMGAIPFDVSAFPVVTAIPSGGRLTIRMKETRDLEDWGAGRRAPGGKGSRRTRRPRRRRPAR